MTTYEIELDEPIVASDLVGNVCYEAIDEMLTVSELLPDPRVLPPPVLVLDKRAVVNSIDLVGTVSRGKVSIGSRDRSRIDVIKTQYVRQRRGMF